MKRYNFGLTLLLIIISFILGLYTRPYIFKEKVVTLIDTIFIDTSTIIIDTVPTLITQTVIIPQYDTIIKIVEGKIRIDTLEVVQDYILAREYETKLDTNEVSLDIISIVHLNKLKEQRLAIKNNRITSIINKTEIIDNSKGWYIGGNITQSIKTEFGISSLYKTKKNDIFEIGAQFTNPNIGLKLGYYRKF